MGDAMARYDTIGHGYADLRRPDPRLQCAIDRALGDCSSIANIGAGTGSYEPPGRTVVAVEPSEVMIRQRRPGAAMCIQGAAEEIPLESKSVDAAMTVLSAHHWKDLEKGLCEMQRVARRRVMIVTWVPDSPAFWLTQDYFPEIRAHDQTIFPASDVLEKLLQRTIGEAAVETFPIPHDCQDGFLCAYWRRPASYLRDDVRGVMSSFARIDAFGGLAKLRQDLVSGRWMTRNSALMNLESLDLGYRIIVCEIRS